MQSTTRLAVVELRRYALRPGHRETFIALFEREFIESQEACGMLPIGLYRDGADPDAIVWFRGFPGMDERRRALEAFYLHSEAWATHRQAANATIVDSDNVLLLRRAGTGFDLRGLERRSAAAPARAERSRVGAAIALLETPEATATALDELRRLDVPAHRVAWFVSETAPNDFPQLPVRSGEFAVVVTGVCNDAPALNEFRRAFESAALTSANRREFLALEPTPRTLYR